MRQFYASRSGQIKLKQCDAYDRKMHNKLPGEFDNMRDYVLLSKAVRA